MTSDQSTEVPDVASIAKRLSAVSCLRIDGDPDGRPPPGKYYGTPLSIGGADLKLAHCDRHESDTPLPSVHALNGDALDEFMDYNTSWHYQSVGDAAMAAFLDHVQRDLQTLLHLLGHDVPLPAIDERDSHRRGIAEQAAQRQARRGGP